MAETEFVVFGEGARLWLVEAGSTKIDDEMADAVQLAKLFDATLADCQRWPGRGVTLSHTAPENRPVTRAPRCPTSDHGRADPLCSLRGPPHPFRGAARLMPSRRTAKVAGVPVHEILSRRGERLEDVRGDVESKIRYANISIIEGIGASQYGIGAVVARLAEAVLPDEPALFTVAAHDPGRQITLSLLSALGAEGVTHTYIPAMTDEEEQALERSAEILQEAAGSII